MKNKKRVDRLVLLYDAPSSKLSAFAEAVRSMLGGDCPLVAVIHGPLQERPEWRRFHRQLAEVPHLDDEEAAKVRQRVPGEPKLPVVMADAEGTDELVELLGAEVIERVGDAPGDLKGRFSYYASLNDLEIPYKAAEPEPESPRGKRRSSSVRWVR